ncbi:MAG: radical SAM protein, partial [Clostridia bacterium]|nr:radical SAM protein [Clostridia bacterium]
CHNPEGLHCEKQLFYRKARCTHCGLCKQGCAHTECRPFGRCLHVCPRNCISVCGEDIESEELTKRLAHYRSFFDACGGGVTFSGGEPLMQWQFVAETAKHLAALGIGDVSIETSGYAAKEAFQTVARVCSLVIMDIKVFDGLRHKRLTGVDNERIKENFLWLKGSGIPYIVRTPLISGKTDDEENLCAIRKFIGDSAWEQLPENLLAKAKYENLIS